MKQRKASTEPNALVEAMPRVADADLVALDLGLMGLMGEMKVGTLHTLIIGMQLQVEKELERRVKSGWRVRK